MRNMRIGGFAPGCLVIVAVAAASGRAGQGPTITLQPVQPTTIPSSTYPPGTTIVGQEITLRSLPARVWLEIHITGWGPETLKVVQATTTAIPGFSGQHATCLSEPAVGAGHLDFVTVSCPSAGAAGNSVCTAALTGACSLAPSRCVAWDGVYPPWYPAGYFCQPCFLDTCHSSWPLTGIPANPVIDIGNSNFRYGFAIDPDAGGAPDLIPSYIGSLVVDIPTTAKGTYTIGFDELQTFMQSDGPLGDNNIPIGALIPARITVPCGRCCHGVGGTNVQCVDALTASECGEFSNSVFNADESCLETGGPACAECVSNSQCDDGLFCNGDEACSAGGTCAAGALPCGELEDCEEERQRCAPRIPAVSNWGMVVMVLALAVAAKLRYANRRPDGA